jgi:hypothetical protein
LWAILFATVCVIIPFPRNLSDLSPPLVGGVFSD